MPDNRREKRTEVDFKGFFCLDGDLVEIMVHDSAPSGVGITASHNFRSGQQGILLAKYPETGSMREMPYEVCWCMRDPMSEDTRYPYRAGLRVIR